MNSCDRQRFNDFLRSAVWGLKDRKKNSLKNYLKRILTGSR